MTATAARAIFDNAAASTTDADAIARIELAREYFTNPAFRKEMEDRVFKINSRTA